MLKTIKQNSFIQLTISVIVVTLFNYWLWSDGVHALFGGYSGEWWSLSGTNGSLSKYLFFLIIPILAGMQGLNMFIALSNGTWYKSDHIMTNFQLVVAKILYIYLAISCIFLFLLALRVFIILE